MAAGNYLERLNQKFQKDSPCHKKMYFGGISVIVCGDPAQLPPVKRKFILKKAKGVWMELDINYISCFQNAIQLY